MRKIASRSNLVRPKPPRKHGGATRVRVAVRARPLSTAERRQGDNAVWRCKPTRLDELEDDGRSFKGKSYDYDNVFGPESPNAEVYEAHCKMVVQGALEGYNGTVFAYGQTGSGKTHTLLGTPQHVLGVLPLSIRDVFDHVTAHHEADWSVHVAYMEIQNEKLIDLLIGVEDARKQLKIVEDKMLGPIVRDVTEVHVTSLRQALQIIETGEKRRCYTATGLSELPCRSHSLFRMRIEYRKPRENCKEEKATEIMRAAAAECAKVQQDILADQASVYLLDPATNEFYVSAGGVNTMRLPISQGITGAVATTGQIVNLLDAYADERFDPSVDKASGYLTTSILCAPIEDSERKVVGVVQFVNKRNGAAFDDCDEAYVADMTKRIGPMICSAQNFSQTTLVSQLNIVDSAGSERSKKPSVSGSLLKETCHINTSLMVLGTCIALLSDGREDQHIPFRNSKLTQILSNSFGGNANTSMICTISPASCNRLETISTLYFASRARKIVNHVQQNVQRDQSDLVQMYEAEVTRLRYLLCAASDTSSVVTLSARESPLDRQDTASTATDATLVAASDLSHLRLLEEEVAEAENLINGCRPMDVAFYVHLHALLAMSTSGSRRPELVVAVSHSQNSSDESGADQRSDSKKTRSELISIDDFRSWLNWLRGTKWNPNSHRGLVDIWSLTATGNAETASKRIVQIMDRVTRNINTVEEPELVASIPMPSKLIAAETRLPIPVTEHSGTACAEYEEVPDLNTPRGSDAEEVSTVAETPCVDRTRKVRHSSEFCDDYPRGVGHTPNFNDVAKTVVQSDGLDQQSQDPQHDELCNKIDTVQLQLAELIAQTKQQRTTTQQPHMEVEAVTPSTSSRLTPSASSRQLRPTECQPRSLECDLDSFARRASELHAHCEAAHLKRVDMLRGIAYRWGGVPDDSRRSSPSASPSPATRTSLPSPELSSRGRPSPELSSRAAASPRISPSLDRGGAVPAFVPPMPPCSRSPPGVRSTLPASGSRSSATLCGGGNDSGAARRVATPPARQQEAHGRILQSAISTTSLRGALVAPLSHRQSVSPVRSKSPSSTARVVGSPVLTSIQVSRPIPVQQRSPAHVPVVVPSWAARKL